MNTHHLALNKQQDQDSAVLDLAPEAFPTLAALPPSMEVALNFELSDTGKAPEWLPLIPAGSFSGRDGRTWANPNPETVINDTRRVGRDIPFDIEHATEVKGPQGEPAPAQAWIRLDDLEIRDGVIWGRVDWNDHGRQLVESKAYKYYSPAFIYDRSGQVRMLKSVGLTNTHNLRELPALNRSRSQRSAAYTPSQGINRQSQTQTDPQQPGGSDDMSLSAAIRQALGLNDNANEAEAVQKIGVLKNDHQTALNRAETPDPDKFVPKADYELALNRASSAEVSLKSYQDKEIEKAVDAAIEAGKVAPASKDYHLATCRQEGGLERFKTFAASAPQVVNTDAGKGGQKPDGEKTSKLTDEQLGLCRQMGVTEDEFLSTLKAL